MLKVQSIRKEMIMTDFKLKAYIKSLKACVHVTEISFRKGFIEYYDYDRQSYVDYYCNDTDETLNSDELIFARSVGKKDKDGTDIYELDVISLDNRLYKVRFDPESSRFVLDGFDHSDKTRLYFDYFETKNCKVVGSFGMLYAK